MSSSSSSCLVKSRSNLFVIFLNNSQQRNSHTIASRLVRRGGCIVRRQQNNDTVNKLRQMYSTNPPSPAPPRSGGLVKNALKYSLAALLGTSAGVLTGYYLMLDQYKLISDDPNEMTSRSFLPSSDEYQSTRFVEYKDSIYRDFPLKIHLYAYESCPYCSQVRTYLDYFGFSYKFTEVDAYDKLELTAFTKARMLPIIVIEDRVNKKRWHLVNATVIISALESLRNESQHVNYEQVLDQYLPIVKQSTTGILGPKPPNKYMILNSELNSIDWRKWVNNEAMPVFKLNSISTLKDLHETFDYYAEQSGWRARYNRLKYRYIYYKKMYRAYNSRASLAKSLENDGKPTKPARDLLNETIEKWESGLGEHLFISGTSKPNLADLSMFGNVRAFEGCALFRESIAKHAAFRSWYERMQFVVTKRYQDDLPKTSSMKKPTSTLFFPLISLDPNDAARLLEKDEDDEAANKIKSLRTLKYDLSQAQVFRILTVTYLVHVLVFTYASWMSR